MKHRKWIKTLTAAALAIAALALLSACNRSEDPPEDSSSADSLSSPESAPESSKPADTPPEPSAPEPSQPESTPPAESSEPAAPSEPAASSEPAQPETPATPPGSSAADDYEEHHTYAYWITGNHHGEQHTLTFFVRVDDSAENAVTEADVRSLSRKVTADYDADINILNFYAAGTDPDYPNVLPFAVVRIEKGGQPQVESYSAP